MAQGTTKGVPIDIDPLLAADSDLLVPSQKAIKTYVDNSNANQVTSVTGTSPIVSTGGTTPAISIPAATGSINGYLSSTDWTTFNGKQNALSGTGIVKSTTGTISYLTDNSTNWDTAYTDRLKWDGGSTGLVAATGRTSLGATTVGGNFFTLTNPSAITFPRINADNTVSTLDAATFRTAISAVGVVAKTTADGTNVTGTTGETLTATLTIPANTFTTGDIIRIEVFFEFTGTAGTKTCRIYTNTSASLSGASLLATTAASAANTRSMGVDSLMAVKSATNTRLRAVSGATYTFTGVTSNASSTVNINWAVIQYIVFSIQLGSAADSGFNSFASIEKL